MVLILLTTTTFNYYINKNDCEYEFKYLASFKVSSLPRVNNQQRYLSRFKGIDHED